MNVEIKRRWVEALRSGRYRQGRQVLVEPDHILGDAFCCLGVLCEIAVQDGVIVRGGQWYRDPKDPMDENCVALPMAVLKWSELPTEGHCASEVVLGKDIYLTTLNDDRKYDFNQIADVIEKSL